MVVFDTSVADLSHLLDDPVDILFGTQLGGGTDINQALAYCQTLIEQPADTILVLFPHMMVAAIQRCDLSAWTAAND